jgi:hypothetical protein
MEPFVVTDDAESVLDEGTYDMTIVEARMFYSEPDDAKGKKGGLYLGMTMAEEEGYEVETLLQLKGKLFGDGSGYSPIKGAQNRNTYNEFKLAVGLPVGFKFEPCDDRGTIRELQGLPIRVKVYIKTDKATGLKVNKIRQFLPKED